MRFTIQPPINGVKCCADIRDFFLKPCAVWAVCVLSNLEDFDFCHNAGDVLIKFLLKGIGYIRRWN